MVKEISKNSFGLIINMEMIATQGENESECSTWRITLVSYLNSSDPNEKPASILRHRLILAYMHYCFDSSKKSGIVGIDQVQSISAKIHSGIRPSNASKPGEGCPFHKSGVEALPNFSEKEEKEPDHWDGAGLSPQQMKSVFPYHIAVDANFIVVQEGNSLSSYLKGITCVGNIYISFFIFQ